MSPDEIRHFLVVFDPATGGVEVRAFGTDYEAALEAYSGAEMANGDVAAALDIVLLSADSLETIEQTHSSYFREDTSRLEALLPR